MKASLKLIQINPCGLVDNRQDHGELKEQKRSMMQFLMISSYSPSGSLTAAVTHCHHKFELATIMLVTL